MGGKPRDVTSYTSAHHVATESLEFRALISLVDEHTRVETRNALGLSFVPSFFAINYKPTLDNLPSRIGSITARNIVAIGFRPDPSQVGHKELLVQNLPSGLFLQVPKFESIPDDDETIYVPFRTPRLPGSEQFAGLGTMRGDLKFYGGTVEHGAHLCTKKPRNRTKRDGSTKVPGSSSAASAGEETQGAIDHYDARDSHSNSCFNQ